MDTIELYAYAKVNLLLKVIGLRKDSYHELLTLFERISLADRITIRKAPRGITLVTDTPITRDPKKNLAYKAAALILKRKGVSGGVTITLAKRIPIAAGLGGGSADAAAALSGIDRLYGPKLGRSALMSLARRLGADVPFFLLDTPFAVGRGRGDRLRKFESDKRLWHLIIYPGFGVSTRDIYRAYDRSHAGDFGLTRKEGFATITLPIGRKGASLRNDLATIAEREVKALGDIRKSLAKLLRKQLVVSGSGPSLFCLYRTKKEVADAEAKLLKRIPISARRGWRVFTARTQE